jgi:diacylglycerol kinase family enzyme
MTRLAIINTRARGALDNARVAEIVAFLNGKGISHRQIPDPIGADTVQAALAGLRPGDCLLAFGGDGTVNQLLPFVLGSGATLAVYPLGTQNNLARRVGMPESLQAFADILDRGEVRKLGLGSVNDHPFATLVSIGAGSVAARLSHTYRGPLTLIGRLWPGALTTLPLICAIAFHRLDRLEVVATLAEGTQRDPARRLVVPALYVSALDETNGGMRTTDLEGLDRESLGVSLSTSFSGLRVLTGYREIFRRASWTHPVEALHAFDAEHLTVRSVANEPLTVYGDGEVLTAATSFEIACLPAALDIVVNPDLKA